MPNGWRSCSIASARPPRRAAAIHPETETSSTITLTQQATLAYGYIRQASLNQGLPHRASTDLHYQLVARAVGLGWPRERVQLIEEALGKSGASSQERHLQSLSAELGLTRVGRVLSVDASRLARKNSEWDRLLDLGSMFNTVIADGARLYDPRRYPDRLLLGVSGRMREAEGHPLTQRMPAGARHQAERGDRQQPLPVGLTRQGDGSVSLTPDEAVQARLRRIFTQFNDLGSARAVREYRRREPLLLPAPPPHGPAPHETVWN